MCSYGRACHHLALQVKPCLRCMAANTGCQIIGGHCAQIHQSIISLIVAFHQYPLQVQKFCKHSLTCSMACAIQGHHDEGCLQTGWGGKTACHTSRGIGSNQNHRLFMACPTPTYSSEHLFRAIMHVRHTDRGRSTGRFSCSIHALIQTDRQCLKQSSNVLGSPASSWIGHLLLCATLACSLLAEHSAV